MLYFSTCRSARADSGSNQRSKLKQPSLLSCLAQSSSQQSSIPKASQQHPSASAEALQVQQSVQEHTVNSTESSQTCDQQSGLCPVCGLQLPLNLLQEHVEEELSLLTDSSDSCMAPACTDSSQTQPTKPPICSAAHRQHPSTARQHPAGRQKVLSASCTLWQSFPSSCHDLSLSHT